MKRTILIGLIITFSMIVVFSQDMPQRISYQGVLKDAAGVIVPNGEYILTFKLYNVETGGPEIWVETKPIDVIDGIINTELGNLEPIPPQIFAGLTWLGITVGAGNELIPRIALTSVPYSFMSMNVADSSVNSAKIRAGEVVKSLNGLKDSVRLIAGSNITITPTGNNLTISSSGGGTGTISGSGTTNYLPRFSGESTIANSIIYQTGGNLGIGTTTPTVKFELAGSDAKIYGLTLGRGSGSKGTNVAFGFQSLDANTTGESNTAIGFSSLNNNTTGNSNSSFGAQSLLSNSSGSRNSSFGTASLAQNTSGNDNSGFGDLSLHGNTNGYENSAFGSGSLQNNNSNYNSAFGYESLYNTNDGGGNSAFGNISLYHNTTGGGNCAFGWGSLVHNTTGHYNTAVGYNAGDNITSGSGNICIGQGTDVPSESSNYQVRIGNQLITYAGIQVAWTVTSDVRWKSNIKQSALGLNFISKLNPVSYIRKNDEKQKTEYGFIAKEIEEVLNELGIEKAGMITIDDEGRYELRYNDLLAPMVKAVQEQQEIIEQLTKRIEELERK
jgi:hypothetical protein